MFDHLNETYGKIKQSDIEANRERLNEDWTIDHSIETLWARVKEVQDFADLAGKRIPNATVIRLIKRVLQKSGVFKNAIDKWEDKAAADRDTFTKFRTHFDEENERRLKKLSSKDAGFSVPVHQANAANGSWSEGPFSGERQSSFPSAPPLPGCTRCDAKTSGGICLYYCWTHRVWSFYYLDKYYSV